MEDKLERIKDIYLEINTKCNIVCKYCYNSDKLIYDEEISEQQIDEIVKFIMKSNVERIIVSGGEPLLHTKFKNIICKLLETKKVIQLISNLYLLDEEMYKFLIENNVRIGCSIDTYDETDKNLKQLIDKKFINEKILKDFYVVTCIYGQSIEQLELLFSTLNKIGIRYINISMISEYFDDEKYIEEVIYLIIKYMNKFMFINSEVSTVLNNKISIPKRYCDASKIIKIDTNLKVYLCYLSKEYCGTIKNGNVIFDEKEYTSIKYEISKTRYSLCKGCNYNNQCKGGCYYHKEAQFCVIKKINEVFDEKEVFLDLFGTKIRVTSKTVTDIYNIKFVFKRYLINKLNDEELDICIKIDDSDIKLNSNNQLSCFLFKYNQNVYFKLKNEEEYKRWEFKNTFLPPIDTQTYHNKFLILHGAAIYKNNKSFIFLGDNFSGKSSILLYAIKNGYKCISDDLIFYDTEKWKIMPYYKPVGIRSTSVKISSEFENIYKCVGNIEHKEFINSKNNVITKLFHLEDLFKNSFIDTDINIGMDNIFYISNENKSKLSIDEKIQLIEKGCCNSNIDSLVKFETILDINNRAKSIQYIKKKEDLYELFSTL